MEVLNDFFGPKKRQNRAGQGNKAYDHEVKQRQAEDHESPPAFFRGVTGRRGGIRFAGAAVVDNLSGPIAQEFRLVLSEIQIGRSVEEALTDLGERIPRPDVQMFVNSVNILKETGGNMAETFQTIMDTVRERQKIEKKIEALTAQGIFQGVIVTLVPFLLLLVLAVVDPDYVRPLFTKPLGWFALFCMVGLQVLGGTMIRRIVKIKV